MRVGKIRQKSVLCFQCNYWRIFARFLANQPSPRHSWTLWGAKGEIRMFWNGSQTENTSLPIYRYHEKLAKSVTGKCFRHLAGPHICDTIDVLTSRSVTYRKFSRHRWKKLRKKKDVTVSDVICQINRTKNRRKSNPKWRILYRKRIQSFKFFKKDFLVFRRPKCGDDFSKTTFNSWRYKLVEMAKHLVVPTLLFSGKCLLWKTTPVKFLSTLHVMMGSMTTIVRP